MHARLCAFMHASILYTIIKTLSRHYTQIIFSKEQAGVKKYISSIEEISKIMQKSAGEPEKVHSDAVLLYLEAAEVKPAFDRVVRVELQTQYSELSGGKVSVCL